MTDTRKGTLFPHQTTVPSGKIIRRPQTVIWPSKPSRGVAELAAEIVTLRARIAELEGGKR